MIYVSKNNNCHFIGTTRVAVKSYGKECLKRKALRHPWKTDIEGADMTCLVDSVAATYLLCAVAGDTCNGGELDLTGIDDEELDKVCYQTIL